MKNFLSGLWAFSRPHTIIGTTLSISALAVIAWQHTGYEASPLNVLLGLLFALFSCWNANIYIVGLNQLSDVEIDKINKPFLPLASGVFSLKTGRTVIVVTLLLSMGSAVFQSAWLMITVFGSLLLGTVYSLPPIRLKRFHFWAAFCILAVRGLLVNVFIFLHFQQLYGTAAMGLPIKIILLTLFMFLVSVVIAWFKDIPDMQGDRRFEIGSLSLRVGAMPVFNWGRALILAGYLMLVLAAAMGVAGWESYSMVALHVVLGGLFWRQSTKVNPAESAQMTAFYQYLWKLFFVEYFVFTLGCLMA